MPEAMQPFLTVRDLLGMVAELHAVTVRRLAAGVGTAEDLRRRVLRNYLEAREREQLRAITRLRVGDDEALGCFVQGAPVASFASACAIDVTVGDLDRMADGYLRRELVLERCFEQLQAGVGPRAEAIFANLVAMKQQNQARLREAMLDF